MITSPNIQAESTDRFNNDIIELCGFGPPTSGTSGTGVGFAGKLSTYNDATNGDVYFNLGTKASPTWTLGLGARIGQVAEVVITSAQVKAIRATPITIVPAQGAGTVIEFLSGSGFAKYGGTNAFTNPQNLAFKLKDGSGTALSGAITAAGWLDQTASEYQLLTQTAGTIYSKANSDNQPLVLHNTGASEITGNAGADNTLLIKVSYAVWTLVW